MKILLSAILLLSANMAAAAELSRADRAEVIQNAARLIEQRYVDASEGKRIARALRRAESRWAGVSDPKTFAKEVTIWLRATSKDGHLGVSHSEVPLAEDQGSASFSAAEMERYYGAHLNHGVQKIERLPGHVMLLELSVFPPADKGADVIAAAMNVAAQGDALIIDLRNNGGGADTPALIAGYVLDESRPLSGSYHRPTDLHTASVSPKWVPGRKFGGSKPLFILTSGRTFSAAEALAYDLQALKRAVIVGERTGGGAHPFAYHRVHRHFALDLPEGKSVNPITGGNWQGTGVKPDVELPADRALGRALELARAAISKGR